jgi:hypothetical protein
LNTSCLRKLDFISKLYKSLIFDKPINRVNQSISSVHITHLATTSSLGKSLTAANLGDDPHGLVHGHAAHRAGPVKVAGPLRALGTEEVVSARDEGVGDFAVVT